jgi:hypothetical protein
VKGDKERKEMKEGLMFKLSYIIIIILIIPMFLQSNITAALIINSIETGVKEVQGGDKEKVVYMYVTNTGEKDIWVDTATLRFIKENTQEDLSQYFVVHTREQPVIPRNASNVKIELLVDVASEVPPATVELDGYIVGWENLIINGSLEELTGEQSPLQLVHWCDWDNPDMNRSYAPDTTTFTHGKQSYKISVNSLPNQQWATTSTAGYPGGGVNKDWLYPIQPSTTYYIEINYKDDFPQGTPVTRVLVWEEFTAQKEDITPHHYFYPTHSENWRKYSAVVVSSPTAAYVRVWSGVRSDGTGGVTGNFWIDGVIFRREPKELIEDASADVKASWVVHADTTPPANITDLSAREGSRHGEIELSWTAPGNNGMEGVAAAYDIRYAETQITESNWSSATQLPSPPQPQASGSREVLKVTGLVVGRTYYFAIKTKDGAGNWSGISNSPSATPYRDTTPPTAPGRPRGYYDSLSKLLRFEWDPASDDESDIVKYLLCIGDTPGGNNVLNDFSVGNATEYTVYITQLNLSPGKRYFAKVKAENAAGLQSDYSEPSEGTLIEQPQQPPTEITGNKLYPPYPVSFNPLSGEKVNIKYDVLDENAKVTIKIYNIFGELVRVINNGEVKSGPQAYYDSWDGRNDKGEIVGDGIYFIHVSIGRKYNKVQKVLVIKK